MKKLLVLSAFAVLGASAQEVSGDWQGTLHIADGGELHLLLHIVRGQNGSLNATLDSLDQNARGIPISTIALKDSTLTFESSAIGGSFQGKLNADASAIEGTWKQGEPLPLTFARAVKPSELDGAWEGVLDVGQKLRLVLHLTTTKDGLTATLESPDQSAAGIPATAKRDGQSLTVEAAMIGAKYQGTIARDLSSIDGTFSQGGGSFPLSLKRGGAAKPASAPRRPQTPAKPYPYRDEDVKYANPGAGIQLAGTFTLPQGEGPFPAAVLITGSGQQDRDETILGHKPFLVLADYLTRRGVAVLRSDDRGAGGSGGEFAAATTADFATDVESAVAYLKTRKEIDFHRIGLIGHSEGGVIAPMVAAGNRDIAFIVMLAGSGVPGDQVIVSQVAATGELAGVSKELVEQSRVQERQILDLIEHEKNESVLKEKLRTLIPSSDAEFEPVYRQMTTPWYRYFLTYDPAPALRKVQCPVLALIGGKDTQVAASVNLPAIRQALAAGGNSHVDVEEIQGLNHLFQHAATGAVTEYGAIEETFAPEVLEKIAAWIAHLP